MLARNHTGVVLDPDEQQASASERSEPSRSRIREKAAAPR
jgi:hypothetical protein